MVELAPVGDPAAVPAAIATVLGITPQGERSLIDTVAEALAGRQLLLVSTTASTCSRPRPRRSATILARSGRQESSRRRASRSASTARALVTVSPLTRRRRRDLRRRHPVRRPGPRRPTRLRVSTTRDRGRGDRDLRDPRRPAARDRAGGGPHGGDERGRGPGSARRPLPAAAGTRAGTGAPAHAASRRRVVLRPADRRRAGAAARRRRCSPAASTCASSARVAEASDEVDVLRHLDSLVRKSLVVADHGAARTRYGLFETIRQFAEDRWRRPASSRRRATGTRRTSPARRPRAGSAGTAPGGATRRLGELELATCARRSGGASTAARSRWRPTSPRTPR